jgi:ParB family chromosome partitioning protein
VQSPCTAVDQGTVITFGHQSEVEAEEDEAIRPLPERLLMELTAHRTLALRDAVANDPHVAMTALLHKLCLDAFEHSVSPACLKASVGHVFFAVQASDLRDTASAKAVAERHEAWKAELPTEEGALWDWLAVLDDDRRTQLLAHCVSFGINALHERPGRYGADPTDHGLRSRLAQADRLAQAVGLDMVAAGWRPTVENYLGRVTKPRILEAVHEARGEQAAQLIDHLKKGDMAKEAERLLDGTGWLPEPLRIAAAAPATDEPSAQGDALPEFLTSDDATADASEERAQQAAE